MFLGHVPDPFDPRDRDFGSSDRAGAAPLVGSDDVDLRHLLPPIRSQIANNCCGHASAAAAIALAALDGQTIESPSVAFLYAIARLLGDPPKKPGEPKLTDWGCGLRYMFKGMSGRTLLDSRGMTHGLGLIAESLWPEVPETVNAVPPVDCFREGENATIESYSRIPDGAGTPDGLRAALRRHRCPTIAMVVDEKFRDTGKAVYAAPGGTVLGGHAMLVVGYSKILDAFLLRNSWGADWFGDEGYAWISSSVAARLSFDKWVIETNVEDRS